MTDDTVYGKASGPGPLHIMAGEPGALVALCGVKRAGVTTIRPGRWGHIACPVCLRQQARPGLTPDELAEVEAEFAEIISAYAAVEAAETVLGSRIRKAAPLLAATRRHDSVRADRIMRAGREAGLTLQQLGDLFGVTRERIRQRLAETDEG